MKAAVWHGLKDIRLEEQSVPEISADEVKIKTAWAGICGSDLHEYNEGPVFIPADAPDPLTGKQAPLNMGHEFAGIIEETGANVSGWQKGDRVAVNPAVSYGVSEQRYDLHDGFGFIGLHADGGFADYVTVKAKRLYAIPSPLSLDDGAVVEPAAVAVQAMKESNITMGDTVAVFGVGPIGLLTVIAAKAAGAARIIALDLSEVRLNKAKDLGATHLINSGNEEPVEAVKNIVPEGVDKSFEVAGIGATFNQAIDATHARGIMNVVSIFAHEITFHPLSLTTSGVSITSTIAYEPDTFQQTIDLMANNQINPRRVITDRIELDNIVNNGFEALTNDKSQSKILVRLSGEQ